MSECARAGLRVRDLRADAFVTPVTQPRPVAPDLNQRSLA